MKLPIHLALLMFLFIGVAAHADDGAAPRAIEEPWWAEEHAGWFGGLIGGTIGLLGGAIGTCAGLRRARTFVLTSSLILACCGVVALFAGIVALKTEQPYHVYFPLLLMGGVCTFAFGFNYPGMKRVYDSLDARERYSSD